MMKKTMFKNVSRATFWGQKSQPILGMTGDPTTNMFAPENGWVFFWRVVLQFGPIFRGEHLNGLGKWNLATNLSCCRISSINTYGVCVGKSSRKKWVNPFCACWVECFWRPSKQPHVNPHRFKRNPDDMTWTKSHPDWFMLLMEEIRLTAWHV